MHLWLQDAQGGEELAHLIFTGFVVDRRVAGPLDVVIAVLKVPSALLVEVRLHGVLPALEHQVVEVRIALQAHEGLADIAHDHLQTGAVKDRVVYVKEHIAGLFRLKHPAAVESAAHDLEGVNQRVAHIAELKLRQMLHVDVLQLLRVPALHQPSVLVP